jgi:replicative DNA helicase
LNLGQAAVSAQNYKEAERYFEAGLQLGKLLDRNPESMIIVRLLGIVVEKKTLNEMINLYTTTKNQEKLRDAEEQLRAAEAERRKLKQRK